MTSCILNPVRSKGDPKLPVTGILAVNPSDARCVSTYAKSAGLKRHFLFNSTLYSSDKLFLAGPAVGAPMAVMCLEKLIVLGAQRIILYGWCGSLQENLHALDILVPTLAVSEEGTSCHYRCSGIEEFKSSSSLSMDLCQRLSRNSTSYQMGPVWTTDAPYRETTEKVRRYTEQGVYGVDMEYSALTAVAKFRQVQLAAVMLVSDELTITPWKPQYKFASFKEKSCRLLEQLSEFAEKDNMNLK
jgi:uridine phosphorylase